MNGYSLDQTALVVLQAVALIDDDIAPLEVLQNFAICTTHGQALSFTQNSR